MLSTYIRKLITDLITARKYEFLGGSAEAGGALREASNDCRTEDRTLDRMLHVCIVVSKPTDVGCGLPVCRTASVRPSVGSTSSEHGCTRRPAS